MSDIGKLKLLFSLGVFGMMLTIIQFVIEPTDDMGLLFLVIGVQLILIFGILRCIGIAIKSV